MEDLTTVHCYCEYTKLEGLETIAWPERNEAEIECANEGTISKKEAFISWALSQHRQRLEVEQQYSLALISQLNHISQRHPLQLCRW